MRPGFKAIVSGWTLIDDFDQLTDRIERIGAWAQANWPLEPDEQATLECMIRSQIARGIARGDFDFLLEGGISREGLAFLLAEGARR